MPKPAVNIGIRAARAGARVLTRMLNRTHQLSVVEKERHDFVTEADRQAERAIIEEISKVYPRHAFLAEESGKTGDSDHLWIIDPLDGTQNFIHDYPHFAISIALQIEGVIEHAIVYDPNRDELFTASRGSGAFVNDRRIRVSDRRSVNGALLATAWPFRKRELMDPYMATFHELFGKASDVRRAGSAALDLAWVAAGRVDGYWETGLRVWDLAAGTLLVEEAGGTCGDFRGGHDHLKRGEIVAANVRLQPAMTVAISQHWRHVET